MSISTYLDDFSRHARHDSIDWNIFDDDRVGAYNGIVADGDSSYDFATNGQFHIITYCGTILLRTLVCRLSPQQKPYNNPPSRDS